jgi:predicted dehydrogenase
MPELELVALVDLVEEQAEARASELSSKPRVFTDLMRALSETSADIVFDCTVPGAHATVDQQAMEAGCHVLCEKPLASSLADARAVIETARRTDRVHAVMQNRRFNTNIRAFGRMIQEEAVGALGTLSADFFIGAHFGGFRAEMEHVLLLDMAIHTFDAARFMSGTRPVRVSCTEWNPAGSWFAHGASAVATFELDNGAYFSYRGSWAAEGCNTSWESSWRAVGTKGTLLWDGADSITGELVSGDEGLIRTGVPIDVPAVEELEYAGHAGCIRAFINAIDSGDVPETVSTDNYYSLAMSLAAIESADTGRTVTIAGL